jgi:hypothetical protein
MATVSIQGWLAKVRQRRDAAAVGRAEAMANETHEERTLASADTAGVAADEQAARIAGQNAL